MHHALSSTEYRGENSNPYLPELKIAVLMDTPVSHSPIPMEDLVDLGEAKTRTSTLVSYELETALTPTVLSHIP